MKALCQEEFAAAKKQQETLEQELKILLLPKDPNDEKGRDRGDPRRCRR